MKKSKGVPLRFPAYVPAGAREYLEEQYKTARGDRRALIEKLALRLPEDIYRINAAEAIRQRDGRGLDRGWWGTIGLPAIVRLAAHSPRDSRETVRKANDNLRRAAKLANELADALDALDAKDSPIGWIVRGHYTMRWALLRQHPARKNGLSASLRECARDLMDAKPDITSPRFAAAASRKAHQIQDLLRGLFPIFVNGIQHRRATRGIRSAMRIIADLILHDGKHTIDDKAVERACDAMRRYLQKIIQ
jgi:hypothetical protein